ncbi:MAG: ATP-binding protein [Anaerolineae bacterium]
MDSYQDRLEKLVHERTAELVRETEERQRTQQALADSEARYRHLLKASRDALAIYPLAEVGQAGKFVEVNDVACQLLGYTREELLNMSPADVTPPGDAGGVRQALLAELLEKGHTAFEWEYLARDGSHIPVEISLQILDLNGVRMVLSSGRDITERMRGQRDLQLIVEGTVGLTGRAFFRALAQQMAQVLDARYALVARLDAEGTSAQTLALWDGAGWAEDFEFALVGTPCQEDSDQQEWFYPTGARARFPHDLVLARLKAESCHGLRLRDSAGEVMGIVAILDTRPMPADARRGSLLRLFAARAAAEMERISAEAALRRHAREQEALYAVASALNSSLDPNDLLATILDALLPVAGADAGWISLAGTVPTEPPRTVAWQGLPDHEVTEELVTPVSDCPACTPYLQDPASPSIVPHVIVQCPHVPRQVLDRNDLHSQACVPLTARGRVLGTLSLAWRGEHQVGKQEESLLLALGYQTALGLHHAQLYQQAHQVDQLRVLGVLDREMATSLDPREVAEVTLKGLSKALGATDAVLLPHVPDLGRYPHRVLTLAEGWCDLSSAAHYAAWRPLLETLPAAAGARARAAAAEGKPGGTAPHKRAYLDTLDDRTRILVVPVADDKLMAHLLLAGPSFSDEQRLLAQASAGRAAQALRNARLYAEVRALLREREETQAQLVHSEKMSALGRLAASIAHEINNPIQAVQGCLGLAAEELEADASTEVLERYITIAREEVKRIGSILHRMRDFYQPAGKSMENTDVREVLEDVLALMARPLVHRKVEVECDWAEDVPTIRANTNQLKQVFLNMVLNAADAMPQGGKLRICVKSGRGREDEDQSPSPAGQPRQAVGVEFHDQGPGIPPELRARLFEPFFTTKEDGSGLGLYISYGIIRAHHGRIVVHSRAGKGTTFTILLPARQPAAPADNGG